MKTKSIGITKRQQDTLNFMKQFKEEKGYMPTIREICKGINVTSPGTAHSHLKELINKGYIEFNGGNRTYRIIEDIPKLNISTIQGTPNMIRKALGLPLLEDKKIEKLEDYTAYEESDIWEVWNKKEKILVGKINEIIDKVNGE